ncbi:hypothetical protein A3K64_00250 [Candidatus Micrarchaeota archaeon RBG_16_36_9]|nr:MAG: hypothetical protein A3K64_00250 [Candidatus Micrarchaeota archaeon RBG_16_36_9]
MPWGDGTGPWWSRGYGCRSAGFRRFSPRMEYPRLTKEEEIEMLKAEKKELEAECLTIQKRLAELK